MTSDGYRIVREEYNSEVEWKAEISLAKKSGIFHSAGKSGGKFYIEFLVKI